MLVLALDNKHIGEVTSLTFICRIKDCGRIDGCEVATDSLDTIRLSYGFGLGASCFETEECVTQAGDNLLRCR